jgi:hypothetical protein
MAGDFPSGFLPKKFSEGNSQPNPQRIRRPRWPQTVDPTPLTPILSNLFDCAANRLDTEKQGTNYFRSRRNNGRKNFDR